MTKNNKGGELVTGRVVPPPFPCPSFLSAHNDGFPVLILAGAPREYGGLKRSSDIAEVGRYGAVLITYNIPSAAPPPHLNSPPHHPAPALPPPPTPGHPPLPPPRPPPPVPLACFIAVVSAPIISPFFLVITGYYLFIYHRCSSYTRHHYYQHCAHCIYCNSADVIIMFLAAQKYKYSQLLTRSFLFILVINPLLQLSIFHKE